MLQNAVFIVFRCLCRAMLSPVSFVTISVLPVALSRPRTARLCHLSDCGLQYLRRRDPQRSMVTSEI